MHLLGWNGKGAIVRGALTQPLIDAKDKSLVALLVEPWNVERSARASSELIAAVWGLC